MTVPIRVLIVDDDALVRSGLTMMLSGAPQIEVVGEASDGRGVLPAVDLHHPDIVLMDIRMPRLDGIAATRLLSAQPHPPAVLVLTTFDTDTDVLPAIEAGATGYVLKDTSSEDLLKAFAKVQAGTPYLSGDLAMQVALAHTSARQNPLAELTPRELQILSLLAEGKPYGRIAEEINVSYKTVVNVSSQLKQKLKARNLPELIRTAVQLLQAAPIAKTSRPDLEKLP